MDEAQVLQQGALGVAAGRGVAVCGTVPEVIGAKAGGVRIAATAAGLRPDAVTIATKG